MKFFRYLLKRGKYPEVILPMRGLPLSSRIAEVRNGSSLVTGDADRGEIHPCLIENDWFEVIVALAVNLFYNNGIATYIWLLSNRKTAHRRGKVELIDATQMLVGANK